MESNQLNNTEFTNEDAIIEALTLDCEVDKYGNKRYHNKDGKLHRIHGPAVITSLGSKHWYKNDKRHREDGPAVIYYDGVENYYIDDHDLFKTEFIQWQKTNGITPIE